MQIAHLDTERTWRGGEIQVLRLACGLRDRGYANLIITQPDTELARRAGRAGIPCVNCRLRGQWDAWGVWRLARLLRNLHVDVLHMHTAHAVSMGVVAAALARIPVRLATRRIDYPLRRNWLSLARYRYGLDRVVCVSDSVRRVLADGGVPQSKLTTIHSAIDPSRFANLDRKSLRQELGIARDTPLIVTVGALAAHKGHIDLLRAMALVRREIPNAHLAIAGQGELRDALEREITRLELNDRVHLLGQREDIPRVLGAADLFVISSHREGICGVLIEAMTAGVPVVATRVSGIPEVVDDGRNGYLVEPHNPAALAAMICRSLREGPARESMVRDGQEKMRRLFHVDTMVEQYILLYERLWQERLRNR